MRHQCAQDSAKPWVLEEAIIRIFILKRGRPKEGFEVVGRISDHRYSGYAVREALRVSPKIMGTKNKVERPDAGQ